MKKICMISTVSLTLKSFVVDTAKYLHDKCGYDVTLICDYDKDFEQSLPKEIHFIPVHMARGIDKSAFSSIKKFVQIFRKENFDVIQYATPNAACYASIAARICKVPIRLYCQWGIRYVGLSGVSRKIFKMIEKFICDNSTNIRAVSPLNKDFAVSEGLYEAKKAVVVGNGGTIGVDMQKYDISKKAKWRNIIRKQYQIEEDDFVFGFSGRISVDKGCRELLSAFRQMEEEGSKAKLVIVGPVDENCGIDSKLVSWARNSENVVLTGMVDRSQMYKYYSTMDVLVHPTYREGFGMVIQEAGALGIPVITTKVPGASEVMIDGVSSIHIEAKNTSQLIDAMRDLSGNPEKVLNLGREAYNRTKKLYDRTIMLENQRLDYEQLIGY